MGEDDPTSDEERRASVRQALGAASVLWPAGLVAVDPEGRSWYHNQRWEDISGTTGRSLRGRPWYLAVHPDDVDVVAAEWRAPARRGPFGPFRTVAADGSEHRCRGEAVAMVGPDGVLTGYLVVLSDADETAGHALSGVHLLDAVLDRSHDIITILNPDGSWRWSSGGALRLLGHQAEFDAATGIVPLLHPDERPYIDGIMARVLEGGVAPDERFVFRLRAADGSWRSMEVAIDNLIDEPAVGGLVVHARDVTDQLVALAELDASNRRLASLISAMSTAVVLADEGHRIIVTNRAFAELFHLARTPEELVGATLPDLGVTFESLAVAPDDARAEAAAIVQARAANFGHRVELFDGRILEIDFVPMDATHATPGYLLLLRDVTDQARAEAERERLLASEQAENRRLAEMDAYKSEFLASVSHELRTPLTSIIAYSGLLGDLLHQRDDPEELAILEVISRNANRLLRLSGDLLMLDSLESGVLPLEVRPVDLASVLTHSVTAVEPEAAAQGLQVSLAAPPGEPLMGDADRLGQLFDNLLSNAVKFTQAGGRVDVTATPEPGGWRVTIADNGMGIPDDEQRQLFDRFFRGSNVMRRGMPGAGLGLSIALAVAHLHRGAIEVDSTVGQGTTLTVRLAGIGDHQPEAQAVG